VIKYLFGKRDIIHSDQLKNFSLDNEVSLQNPEKKSRENYTRVTSILYPFSGLDKLDPEVVDNAARRGTQVHKICEGIISGLGEIGVDEETRPYVSSFLQWWNIGHEVLMMEQRFWDDDLEITGQIDLMIREKDELYLVDLKTSSKPSLTWPAQGAAYAYLAMKYGHDVKKIRFLHLLKSGKAPKIYEYPVDDEFFLSIYRTWKHFYCKAEK
jgi:hypothetical protein